MRESDGHLRWQQPGSERVLASRQRDGLAALADLAEYRRLEQLPALPDLGVLRSARALRRPMPPPRATVLTRSALPLLVILLVQAALSVRLIWTNTAYQDEALYLWAGHLEIAHWLHGTAIPPFATYFSGAPVLYPPLGAIADGIGGLAVARLESLAFMLGATSVLWCTTARLYGRRAASFAAALFAVLGPTLHLGALATFDALALLLVAIAAWCLVRAGPRADATGWTAGAALALALANATAYSTAIFDPVLILLAILIGIPVPGGKRAVMRGAALFGYVTAALVMLVTIGGAYYSSGIGQTTLARTAGDNAPAAVLAAAGQWSGLIVAAGLLGALACWAGRSGGLRALIPLLLAGAALIVPLEQARIDTLVSLDKHVDVGAWFAAVAAGYAADRLLSWGRPRAKRLIAVGTCAALLGSAGVLGITQASVLYSWPNGAQFVTGFAPLVSGSGRLLVEDPSIAEYYLPAGTQWRRWSNTRSIILASGGSISASVGGAGAPAAYARYIARGYFSVVALNYEATPGLDRQIAVDLGRNSGYQVVATLSYGPGVYTVWRYERGGRGA